jgi:hypothetical protein
MSSLQGVIPLIEQIDEGTDEADHQGNRASNK